MKDSVEPGAYLELILSRLQEQERIVLPLSSGTHSSLVLEDTVALGETETQSSWHTVPSG